MLDVDDWFFLPTTLPANTRVLHASTGTLHHILGALYRVCMRIDEAYYELSEYLLGCNEQWSNGYINAPSAATYHNMPGGPPLNHPLT